MLQARFLLSLAVFLLAGCVTGPASNPNADDPAARAQVERRLNEVFNAAAKKDLTRLDGYHLYGPKFTKFASEQPSRQDTDAARKGEHDGLSAAADLTMRAEDLKIDVFGDVAVATFLLNYSFTAGGETVVKSARSTLVFVSDGGEWKIAHEHFSAVSPRR